MVGKLVGRLTVSARIYMLIIAGGIGLVSIVLLGVNTISTVLTHERQEQTRRLVEAAAGMVTYYQAQAKAGAFSEDKGKELALNSFVALENDCGQYIWISDRDGKMLSDAGKAPTGRKAFVLKDPGGEKVLTSIIEKAGQGGGFLHYYQEDASGRQRPALTYVKEVPGWKWVVGGGIFLDLKKDVWRAARGLIAVCALLLIVCMVVAALIGRSVSIPIRRITAGLAKSSDLLGSVAVQLSATGRRLSEGGAEQSASLEETSASLEQMASMTKNSAESASRANQLMLETRQVITETHGSMDRLNSSMAEISKASEKIANIIKTIDEIAFQTNLLALNAAVEAARAGEAGAGFAVVADEVRNLAARAADASRSTAVLIESTVTKIKEGSEVVESTSSQFIRVAESSSEVGMLLDEIAAASGEQARGIEQVSRSVTAMEQVVQRNASKSGESASVSQEMNVEAERIKEFVGKLISLVDGA